MNRGGWIFFPSRISDTQQEKKKNQTRDLYKKQHNLLKKKRNMKYLSDFQIRKS